MANLHLMEPMLVPEAASGLDDLVFELVQKASGLSAALPTELQREVGRLVRSMNCYYSNFLEGHQTHPRDIEKALNDEFRTEPRQRALQLEARAHIELQKAIDAGNDLEDAWPASAEYARWLHREFCSRLPPEMLVQRAMDTGREILVIPGEYREGRVKVGRHEPPPAKEVEAFMRRFSEAYEPRRLSKTQQLLSAATAHHRLVWIHPFADGNGRVVRLMSHALLLRLGVGSSLWSVSRGLARTADKYKQSLAAADCPRRNDLDGRGNLSLEALIEFCRYFLETCLDQVEFMRRLLQPQEILRRVELYVADEVSARRLPKGSFEMLREVYYQGAVPRGRAPEITGYEERRARKTVATLLNRGLLVTTGPRAPVALGIPMDVVERWFPALYPVA